MSIASEITRISGNIADAYTALDAKGATLPENQNSDNLADTIDTITTGGGSGTTTVRGNWLVPQEYLALDALVEDVHTAESPDSTIGMYFDRTSFDTYYFSTGGYDLNNFKFYTINGEKTPQLINDWLYGISLAQDENYIISTYSNPTSLSYLYNFYFPISANGKASGATVYFEQMNAMKYAVAKGTGSSEYVVNLNSYNNLDEFHYLTPFPMSATTFKYRNNLKYIPSVTEVDYQDGVTSSLGTAYTGQGVFETLVGLPNLPYGADFSSSTTNWDFSTSTETSSGRYCYSIRLKQMYIKLPNANITFNGTTSALKTRGVCLTADNWTYIAQNAPTVSGKTLTMNAYNGAALGATNKALLESKGWTVTIAST